MAYYLVVLLSTSNLLWNIDCQICADACCCSVKSESQGRRQSVAQIFPGRDLWGWARGTESIRIPWCVYNCVILCVCVANRPIWRFQYVSIQQNTATENLIPSYESYSIKCTDWNYVKLIVRWRWPACQRLWEIWWTIVELMKRSRCQMSCPRSLKVLTVDHPSLFCIGVGSREQVQTLFCSIFQSTCWMVLKKTVANVANEFTVFEFEGKKHVLRSRRRSWARLDRSIIILSDASA